MISASITVKIDDLSDTRCHITHDFVSLVPWLRAHLVLHPLCCCVLGYLVYSVFLVSYAVFRTRTERVERKDLLNQLTSATTSTLEALTLMMELEQERMHSKAKCMSST